MPIYTLQGPDGKTYDIEGPEGATAEQLGQFVLAQNSQQSAPLNLGDIRGTSADPVKEVPVEQQKGDASFTGRVGMGIMDPVHGGAQALTHMLPEGVVNAVNSGMQAVNDAPIIGPVTKFLGMTPASSQELDKRIQTREQEYQAARKEAGQEGIDFARLGGNIIPTVAMGMGGSLLNAGANAIGRPALASNVFAKIAAGAGSSALPGALMPVTSGDFADEKTRQMTLAAALGAAFPAVAQAAPAIRSLIDPFSKGGQDRIVGNAIRKSAGNDADQALTNLRNAQELVPGSPPTAGQAAGNAGIASLERTATQTDPIAMNMMANRLAQQNEARVSQLQNMAGTPAQRKALEDQLEKQSRSLYSEAFKENVPVTDELVRLASRPSMRRAESRAQGLAQELSIPFSSTLSEMRPKPIYIGERSATPSAIIQKGESTYIPMQNQSTVSSVLKENKPRNLGAGMTEEVAPTEIRMGIPPNKSMSYLEIPPPPDKTVFINNRVPMSGYMDIPPVDSIPVRDAHTLKMAMDALTKDPTLGISGREIGAINATRNKLLDMLPESYQAARQSHIELNRPINQMDIANLIMDKSINKLTGKLQPQAYARALNDDTAKQAVGLRTATMQGMLSNEQQKALTNIADDLARADFAQTAGRGVGSDTVQKLAYSNILDKAGIPSMVAGSPIAGIGGRIADTAYKRANEELRQKLAQALLDPKETARLLEKATPSEKLRILSQALGQFGTVSGAIAYPTAKRTAETEN